MTSSKPGRPRSGAALTLATLSALLVLPALLAFTDSALALSEIKQESVGSQAEPARPDGTAEDDDAIRRVPLPAPAQSAPRASAPATDEDPGQAEPEIVPDEDNAAPNDPDRPPSSDPDAPLPQIVYDLDKLPEPVRRMRNLIVEACKSGDVNALKPLLGTGASATQLTLGEMQDDPVEFLKGLSGDEGGQEILAIMEEVLSAGYVHLDVGTPQELYVWPYFFAIPLDRLDARQRVELFKLVTAGDYEDMRNYGSYIFYRVGISPDGEWRFFVAGD